MKSWNHKRQKYIITEMQICNNTEIQNNRNNDFCICVMESIRAVIVMPVRLSGNHQDVCTWAAMDGHSASRMSVIAVVWVWSKRSMLIKKDIMDKIEKMVWCLNWGIGTFLPCPLPVSEEACRLLCPAMGALRSRPHGRVTAKVSWRECGKPRHEAVRKKTVETGISPLQASSVGNMPRPAECEPWVLSRESPASVRKLDGQAKEKNNKGGWREV